MTTQKNIVTYRKMKVPSREPKVLWSGGIAAGFCRFGENVIRESEGKK